MHDVDAVVAEIGEMLRPHCDLAPADLTRVSEAVLLLGARHALRWVEGDGDVRASPSGPVHRAIRVG